MEAVGSKDLFAGRVGQNRGILPVFTLLWMKIAAALTLERMRMPHNANLIYANFVAAQGAPTRTPGSLLRRLFPPCHENGALAGPALSELDTRLSSPYSS